MSKQRFSVFLLVAGIFAGAFSGTATAEEHVITAAGIKYSPMFTYIEPGDTVIWRNMVGHNVETIDSMVPEGQEKILSELGQRVAHTFDTVGIVIFKCTPHWTSRMGGAIVVGTPENPGAIIDAYLAAIEEDRSALPAKGILRKLRRDLEEKDMI